MEQVNFSLFLLIIPSALCILSITVVMLLKKENKLLSRQLTETTVTLELTRKQIDGLQERYAKINEFQNSLQVAELTTKFQKPRLNARNFAGDNSPVGKYSSVESLSQQGLSIEEIASILAVSTHEAQQLVNLSKLAQGSLA
jgi:hypothetical protein